MLCATTFPLVGTNLTACFETLPTKGKPPPKLAPKAVSCNAVCKGFSPSLIPRPKPDTPPATPPLITLLARFFITGAALGNNLVASFAAPPTGIAALPISSAAPPKFLACVPQRSF